jgi:hypothetical protein
MEKINSKKSMYCVSFKNTMKKVMAVSFGFFISILAYHHSFASDVGKYHLYLSRYDGTEVSIWDNDTSSWTTTLANGDPIDTGTANSVDEPQIAIDSTGIVYVTYAQEYGGQEAFIPQSL